MHKECIFLLANCFSSVPKFYMYEHTLSCFAAHSVVIFLTKEEIANCKSSSWSERNQLWIQLRIQVRGTTPKIYNRNLQVQFWERGFSINFTDQMKYAVHTRLSGLILRLQWAWKIAVSWPKRRLKHFHWKSIHFTVFSPVHIL